MFAGKRYVTPGVIERLPVGVQMLLWNLIDKLEAEPASAVDYLQVFELKPGDGIGQKIIHSQEVPPYRAEYVFDNVAPLTVKVYAIDEANIVRCFYRPSDNKRASLVFRAGFVLT